MRSYRDSNGTVKNMLTMRTGKQIHIRQTGNHAIIIDKYPSKTSLQITVQKYRATRNFSTKFKPSLLIDQNIFIDFEKNNRFIDKRLEQIFKTATHK